ncbi:diaminopimelate epimerase [Alkaliphilus hydrothermalis]|uniref:Diaminopimelate epimerase n=1 Tax=Alkaliphilus hydrothermalis TaxID=1482730 RepID=A0ABS2NNJ7_9FIRM|nr:diaminopimelate epimerase [Alkaliphilus hydrothermalis]MBM7614520.1 diaminopimelate epimerase [Alkaliphilus hydrothermalis]
MNIPFKKMHGAGNDFVVIKLEELPEGISLSDFAAKSCHRHFGIGADGILVVAPSEVADTKMIYYNSDGSLANMCGNGIRCFAKFVHDEGIVKQDQFSVETLAGVLLLEVKGGDCGVEAVKVNMGHMIFEPSQIPVATTKDRFIKEALEIDGEYFEVSTVLMGVPHTVIFSQQLNIEYIKKYGPMIEKHHLFPKKTNVNFAKIIDRGHIQVKTWERGAGYTLACGTGVTSVCGIAHHLDYVDGDVTVDADGGRLRITITRNDEIFMEGPATDICRGIFFMK